MFSQHTSPGVDWISVYWLQQTEADVPPDNDWLSESEGVCLRGMRFAKRRADWRLGRWTAKCATAIYLNLLRDPSTLAQIEIRSSPSGAPEVFYFNQPAPVAISLSHRAKMALCTIGPLGTDLGCDLEMIEPHSDAFIADYFTAEEQALVARMSAAERPRLVALIWSAKESALKALRAGLRLDTRSVVVTFLDDFFDKVRGLDEDQPGSREGPGFLPSAAFSNWRPLQVRHGDGQVFQGWWQHAGKVLRTLVAAPPPACPIRLELPSNRCQFGERHDKMIRTHLLRFLPISIS
jgi:4'-phosphopantetheinyl transferase